MYAFRRSPSSAAGMTDSPRRDRAVNGPRRLRFEPLEHRLVLSSLFSPFVGPVTPPAPPATILFDTVTQEGLHIDGEIDLSQTGGPDWTATPYLAEDWGTFQSVFAASSGILYRDIGYSDQSSGLITQGKTYTVYPQDLDDTVIDGISEAIVEVTESPGDETRVRFVIEPPNQPPVADAGGPYEISEGEDLVLAGSGSDADSDDNPILAFTWDVNGDGVFGDATGASPVLTRHDLEALGLGDDGSSAITLRVSDDETFTDSTADLTITNSAPVVTEVRVGPSAGGAVRSGDVVTIRASFTDVGKFDTHTAKIDWGDGITREGTVAESDGSGTVSARHKYAKSGIYTITVTVTDDDTGVGFETASSFVTGVRFTGDGTLQIVGTNQKNDVLVYRYGNRYMVMADFFPGGRAKMFPVARVKRMEVAVCGGNDRVEIAANVFAESELYGGAGFDSLQGGSGNDVISGGDGGDRMWGGNGDDRLSGGTGNDSAWGGSGDDVIGGDSGHDKLFGNFGDDLLLGHSGADRLWGQCGNDVLAGGDDGDRLDGGSGLDLLIGGTGGDVIRSGRCCGAPQPGDMLIAGSTIYDNDERALRSILGDWSSGWNAGLSYTEIVDGLVADWLEPGRTAFDDGVKNRLIGNNNARDLFFAHLDPIDDRADLVSGLSNDTAIELD
jgi:Ca2+-binding RTX toxin-like protein